MQPEGCLYWLEGPNICWVRNGHKVVRPATPQEKYLILHIVAMQSNG